jgi:acetyl-CoA synthetase
MLEKCPSGQKVLVVKRTNTPVIMKEGRDIWLQPLLDETSDNSVAEIMDSEDPLFILYTSGSTGKPKEWYIHRRVYGFTCLYI